MCFVISCPAIKGTLMSIAKQTVATVIPALQYQDAPAAIDFLCRAFGFTKNAVYEGEGGSIAHAQLTLGNGMVMLGSARSRLGVVSLAGLPAPATGRAPRGN
jgi:uncharacterized glyoxalase superfamily protein PhnB